MNLNVQHIYANCYSYTFKEKKVLDIVRSLSQGKVLNLFAGKYVVKDGEYRVDLDELMPNLDFVGNAKDFLKINIEKFDTIIYDPPWNERKSKEFFEGRYIGKFTKLKDDIAKLLNPNGRIISLGYTITNFGKKRNMELSDLTIVNPRGEIRPYFISMEINKND